MRDIIVFTKEPISAELCKAVLLGNIKNCIENGMSGFFIEKPSTLFFDIENELLSQTLECDFSADERTFLLTDMGADEVFLNSIQYHRSVDVKKILENLLTIYPDIRLFVDEIGTNENSGYCTAAEYLAQFEDKKSGNALH